jgi:hypothetical protein
MIPMEETIEYKVAYQSTLLNLALGADEQVLQAVLDTYEEDEMFEACLGMQVAIEQFKTYEGFAKIRNPLDLDN